MDASYSELSKNDNSLVCCLCPRNCRIPDGSSGFCKVRNNQSGKMQLPYYGQISALSLDPIEKKPLYHWRPGSSILSVGFLGCMMDCPFCKNFHISKNLEAITRTMTPEELIAVAKESGHTQIAYTYSEPLVHFEYLLAAMKEARKANIANILITNGCINKKPANDLLPFCDAVNVDLKAFTKENYQKILGGNLDTVKAFIGLCFNHKIHLEITSLIIADFNDSKKETQDVIDFIGDLSVDIPWHISSYHPNYKWKDKAYKEADLQEIAERAYESLNYVYAENVPRYSNNTECPICNNILIERENHEIKNRGVIGKMLQNEKKSFCKYCENPVPIQLVR
jgi:pyruvate formate lyase activating enzyme